MKTISIGLICFVLALVAACSHPIEIVGEGDVWSTGGRICNMEGDLPGETNCSKNYVVGAYQETYYAVSRENWQFDHWGNYCSNAIDNSCSFDIPAVTVQQVWGLSMPPLQAVFTEVVGKPITETVIADGREWAQVDLFNGVPWADINAACPAGVCAGTLNGYDMTHWTWASGSALASLVNHYVPGQCTTQCNDVFVFGTDVVALFIADGFRFTCGGGDITVISGAVALPESNALGFIGYSLGTAVSLLSVGIKAVGAEACSDPGGAWFHR